VAEEQSLKFPI